MKKIIRIISVMAMLALFLGGAPLVPVAAQGEQVTVSIDAPGNVPPSSNFTATVNITQVQNLNACNYDISFDPAVLRLNDVTSGNISGTSVPVAVWNLDFPGTVTIVQHVSGLTGINGTGSLAQLWFSTIGGPGASSNITLSNGTLSNTSAQRILATWVGDRVQIASGVLQSITVTSDNTSVPKGLSVQFSAVGRYSDNTTANLTGSVVWTSSNTTVASIASTGLAQTLAVGQTQITATLGTVNGSTNLTVTNKALVVITITPDNYSIPLGRSLPFTAMGRYTDNTTENTTTSVTWTSANTSVASIGAHTGLAQSLAVGQTRITATLIGISGNTILTVNIALLETVNITPNSPVIVVGTSLPFTLMGSYSDNTTQDLTTSASWTSSNTTVASIGLHSGIAQSLVAGQTTIIASLAAVSGSTILTVTTLVPPVIITNNATDITINSATLHGRLDSFGDYTSAQVSFEWGTISGALDHTTTAQTLTTTSNFSANLTGLPQDTPHYYRAKAVANSITVYGSQLSFTTQAIVVWTVPMTASTPNSGSNPDLAFGTKVGATDNVDADIDIPGPPPAPGSVFEAYFPVNPSDPLYAIFQTLYKDYRAPGDSNQWTLKVRSQSENITLSWNTTQIPAELSAYMNTGAAVIDMKAQNQVVLVAGDYTITISVSKDVTVQISLKAGWNMVSLPVVPSNTAYKSVFPTALVVYTWNPVSKSYSVVTNLESAKGYWVAVQADTVVNVVGAPVVSWTRSINAGWNMIGSVNAVVGISNPEDTPDNSVQKFTYWWNPTTKSYLYGSGTQAIQAGRGYWVAAINNCTLTLSTTSK